jgi:hypothetical protein
LQGSIQQAISERMNALPWRPESIAKAFAHYITLSERVDNGPPGLRDPPLYLVDLTDPFGVVGWQITSDVHHLFFSGNDIEERNEEFTQFFEEVRRSEEFDLLRTEWKDLRPIQRLVAATLDEVSFPDHFFGKCPACTPYVPS